MKQFSNRITVSAPGKLMLFGEHSVVYGYPSIVTAMNTRIFVTAKKENGRIDKHVTPQVKECKFVKSAVDLFRRKFQIQEAVTIQTKGDFSHQVGLGSSSAVTVATFAALSCLFGKNLSSKEIFDLSYKVTIDIQGVGSGFDIAAAAFGGTLYYLYGGKMIKPLKINSLPLVVGYSGVKADTPTLIHEVRKEYHKNKGKVKNIFTDITKIVNQAKSALVNKDYQGVGRLMTQNHKLLKKLGVSTGKLDEMVNASLNAGAYGAKLSGAGGGDCMIALIKESKRKKVEQAIESVGGEIIHVENNAEGARREDQRSNPPIRRAKIKDQKSKVKQRKTTDDQNESFIVVDKNDKVLGYKTRKECHSNKNLIHRAVDVLIFNKKDEVLLQKRSKTKDLYPGFYGVSVAGHVSKGQSYEEAAKREILEEIGVKISLKFALKYLGEFLEEREMTAVFTGRHNGPFNINNDELELVKFFRKDELFKMKNKLTKGAIRTLQEVHLL